MKVYLIRHKPLCELDANQIRSLNLQDIEERLYVKKLTKIRLRDYRKRFDERMGIIKNGRDITEEHADAVFIALIDYLDIYIRIRKHIKDELSFVAFLEDSDSYLIIDQSEFDLIVKHRLKLWKELEAAKE